MKFAITLSAIAALIFCVLAGNPEDYTKAQSVYDFSAIDIHGKEVPLEKYKGNVLLIVNVASNCGLTERNYKQLNELYEKYEGKGLRILAFPSNQFLQQEPGTDKEIEEFTQKHGVKFDVFSKVDVNGDNAIPLYKFLKLKQPGTNATDSSIEWNFTKFIVDKDGQVVERDVPKKDPLELIPSIEKYI
uniref:Glutathione peroxidase n=1 Tax=Dendroctonus ponderosae TaxID=77166 RepID=A0AAR5QIG3_DENPD